MVSLISKSNDDFVRLFADSGTPCHEGYYQGVKRYRKGDTEPRTVAKDASQHQPQPSQAKSGSSGLKTFPQKCDDIRASYELLRPVGDAGLFGEVIRQMVLQVGRYSRSPNPPREISLELGDALTDWARDMMAKIKNHEVVQ